MWSARSHAKFRGVSRCFAKREKNRSPQLAQLGPLQLVSYTTARPARPFAARLIHYLSPSLALLSSSHSPQLAQPDSSQLISSTTAGPWKLVSFITARPARSFEARLITHSSPSSALRCSSHSLQLAKPGPSQLVRSSSHYLTLRC